MATTPEGKIKKKVSTYLRSIDGLWYFMPVPGGYGQSTLDYIGCYRGRFFAIETKAPGNKPTERQKHIMQAILASGGRCFVIDSDELGELQLWIASISEKA